jgi:16S rRNA (guanine527-N7)-methyltransferase
VSSLPPGARDGATESAALVAGAAALGVALDDSAAARLLALLDELVRWNGTYNLTAITERREMLTHHLLDSLAVWPLLEGRRIADVGTGAGFPGLPLAIVDPQRHFTLFDSNGKKVRFVAHAARTFGLGNVEPRHARAESFVPDLPFDTVVARAFAPLPELLARVAGLCGPATRVLAMKGRRDADERSRLPAGWQLEDDRELVVPGLDEQRHVLVLRRAAAAGSLR